MNRTKNRQRVFQLEGLEERLALSTVTGLAHHENPQGVAAHVHPTRVKMLTSGFNASGQATPTGFSNDPNGGMTVEAKITGTAAASGKRTALSTAFGKFTGTIEADLDSTSGSTVIRFKKGTLAMSLTTHGTLESVGSDSGTFTITGGTKAFAKATGGGTVNASISGGDSANPILVFQFSGSVTARK